MTLEELYHLYHEQVFNLAIHYVQNVEDAEEITQDVFVKINDKLSSFRAEANPGTWIYRIAMNASLDHLRARKAGKRAFWLRMVSIQGQIPAQEPGNFNHPGINLEHKEALERLFAAINKLPERQRSALILLKLEGMNTQEAAKVMNLSSKAMESLFQRAKTQLKSILDKSKEHEL